MTPKEMILSNDFMDIISDATELWELSYPPEDYFYQPVEGDFGIFYINRGVVPPLNVSNYTYRAIPKLFGLMQEELIPGRSRVFDPSALDESGILQVQRPPLSLTGSGVVVGFIDTGIRYTEDVFRNEDGSSRIMSIWDQTIQTGEPPAGLQYGTEYTNEMINKALKTDNPRLYVPSWDDDGHGTAVASVAAGSILEDGNSFRGAAPDCQIVMVKCKDAKPYLKNYYLVPENITAYSETDLILAVKYIEQFAITYRRPVVICFGMGTNMGGHAANSPFGAFINRTAVRRSRIIVAGGGNEGNTGHHYLGSVRGLNNNNTYEDVEIQVKEGSSGFVAEMWGTLPNALAISIRSPGGETTQRVDFRTRESRRFTFVYESTEIRVDHVLVEENSGDELFVFRFVNPTPGVWVIRVSSAYEMISNRGVFNVWLPIKAIENAVFLRPDPYITLTGPANADEIVSVSTYNDINGSFFGASGRGFTRVNEIKPDIAAPGVEVDTILGKMTGASMAAAITSGAAAQFMQWAVVEGNDRHVESREFRSYLILGATRVSDQVYPSREWGYGRLNIAGTFNTLAGLS